MASIQRVETIDLLNNFYQFILERQVRVYGLPIVEIVDIDIELFFKKNYPEIKDFKHDIWNIIKIE